MQNFRPVNRFHDKRISFVHYTGTEGDQVKIQLNYREGGINYASYKTEERGFQLVVTCVKLINTQHGTMEQSSPFSDCNFRVLVEEAGRYNKKRLTALAEEWDEFAGEFATAYQQDRSVALQMLRAKLGMLEAA